jgi:fatty acid CoA ligase FadD9
VQSARIGDTSEVPHLGAPLINKYLTDLRHLGLLDTDEAPVSV